jgi:hypothetical protein
MRHALLALLLSASAGAQIPTPAPAPAGVPGNFTCTAAGKAYITTYQECFSAFRRQFEATAGCAAEPRVSILDVDNPQWGLEAQAVLTVRFLYLYNKAACGSLGASTAEDAIRTAAVDHPLATAIKDGKLGLVTRDQVLGAAFTQLQCVEHADLVAGTSSRACRCKPIKIGSGVQGEHWSSRWQSCMPDSVVEQYDVTSSPRGLATGQSR